MAKAPNPPASGGKSRTGLGSPVRGTGSGKIFTSKPVDISFAGPEHRYTRADLLIDGLFHGEASYEGRIFFNNPSADHDTLKALQTGYAGSFHIFGHGGCLGDPGHCEVNESKREQFDFRSPHPLTLASKRVTVTEALRQVAKTADTVTVTIVPIVTAANTQCDQQNVLRFDGLKFLTYNS